MKKDREIISKIRGAMIYPSIVISTMIIIGILMTIYVIPNITGIFKEIEIPLPLATRVLIAISDFIVTQGWLVIIGGVIFIISFVGFITWKKGKYYFHKTLLKIPIIGKIIKKINLARFARNFSSLLKTGIPIVRTFEITSQVLGNLLYQKALLEAKEKVKKGVKIEESLRPYSELFPPVILQMIAVGEETGALDNILEEAAIFYEEDVSRTMSELPSIIEPILIIILGAGVAGMAVAIIMPMYSLSQAI